ncbi:MAG: alkylhydroperoxidase [Cellvibrionales bacterium]|nr:MAG: alkylhydroperoxidase [Cellvibrionales bacterium]
MNDASTVKYEQEIPDIMSSLANVHEVIDTHGLDRTVHHLVQLRASQINGCAFCIKMHTEEARQDGETNERLDQVIVWDQVGDFSKPEEAALAWTEALTVLAPKTDLGTLRARLRQYFSEPEIGALTATIAMINLWNRIGISRH